MMISCYTKTSLIQFYPLFTRNISGQFCPLFFLSFLDIHRFWTILSIHRFWTILSTFFLVSFLDNFGHLIPRIASGQFCPIFLFVQLNLQIFTLLKFKLQNLQLGVILINQHLVLLNHTLKRY
jgi:hypothetical protein